MTATSGTDLYYDPFDTEIDKDPHPLWRRLREEAPLYYNDKHDFFALSRFDDVDKALMNWDLYRSGQGSTLEIIKANITLPPGIILMEDPPIHDVHRGLLSRVFTPKKMNALEPKVREFCARSLDPLVGAGGFDFIGDLGAQMPCARSACYWASPNRTKRPSATDSTKACASKKARSTPLPTISCRPEARCSPSTSIGEPSTPPTTL
jgi:cytochrome P450